MAKDLIVILENPPEMLLSLEEVCAACHVDQEKIIELVENDVVVPRGFTPEDWQFPISQLKRIRMGLRLAHDLELDYAAVAVVLDLLERIDEMKTEIDLFEKHFLNL